MSTCTKKRPECDGDGDGDMNLPGFRFNPTDEELVSFYLRRKVDKKPLKPEIIKQADIYKHDPWDLPNNSKGETEWYFFCKRGRKYRNSGRPNRVTGSGFWKATGIDRPITSSCDGHIIGLKKSLVYYLGIAGKGTKTEWMMHEYRLPSPSTSLKTDSKFISDEAEVWTLCRLLRRNLPRSKSLPEWKKSSSSSSNNLQIEKSFSETCSIGSSDQNTDQIKYISFSNQNEKQKPYSTDNRNNLIWSDLSFQANIPPPPPSSSAYIDSDMIELLKYADWDDLQSIVNGVIPSTKSIYPSASS